MHNKREDMYVRRCSHKPCANIDVVFGKRANLDRRKMSRGQGVDGGWSGRFVGSRNER